MKKGRPTFFATPEKLRAWLAANHAKESELWVGFHKKGSGRPSITWPESVEEALCFGWIDGIRKSLDEESYVIRFSPRKAKSKWSAVNIARAKALMEDGRMRPAGIAAFEARVAGAPAHYSHEGRALNLAPAYTKRLRANKKAWAWYSTRSPSYKRATTHWIMSAKREETRGQRVARLIAASAKGESVSPLLRPGR